MTVSKIYRDIHAQLEAIQDSIAQESHVLHERENTAAVNRFLSLEKELIQNETLLEIDEATRQKINGLIRHLKASPALETMLGTLQAQFFLFLNRLENDMKDDSKHKIRSVQGTSFDRLERH